MQHTADVILTLHTDRLIALQHPRGWSQMYDVTPRFAIAEMRTLLRDVRVWIWRHFSCLATCVAVSSNPQRGNQDLPNMESLKVVWNVRGCDTFFEGLFAHYFRTGGSHGKANQMTQKWNLGSTTLKNQDFQNCILQEKHLPTMSVAESVFSVL